MLEFPAVFFVRFFKNHGMLSVDQRPTWRVIQGGSSRYIGPLTERFKHGIRLNAAIEGVVRQEDQVELRFKNGDTEHFDQVVLACHSNQALKLLKDPSPEEMEILGAMRYQVNETVLHTDTRMLPKRPLAWAAWNYHLPKTPLERVAVTYNMNILQGIDSDTTFCVTLNHLDDIDPAKILKAITYEHPVFDQAAVSAQERFGEVSGVRRTHYAGAYWGFGFHEDGVKSGLRAAHDILHPRA
jgi:predicted NAD/FAD-binding protein